MYRFKHDDIELTFNFNIDHIGELVEICKRFAAALGYHEATIEKWFGCPEEEINITF